MTLAPIILRSLLALTIFLGACSAPAPAVFAKSPALKVGPGLSKAGPDSVTCP